MRRYKIYLSIILIIMFFVIVNERIIINGVDDTSNNLYGIVIDSEKNIKVEKEELMFDFRENDSLYPKAYVTNKYNLLKSNLSETVKIRVPYIGSFDDLTAPIILTANETEYSPKVYYTNEEYNKETFNLEEEFNKALENDQVDFRFNDSQTGFIYRPDFGGNHLDNYMLHLIYNFDQKLMFNEPINVLEHEGIKFYFSRFSIFDFEFYFFINGNKTNPRIRAGSIYSTEMAYNDFLDFYLSLFGLDNTYSSGMVATYYKNFLDSGDLFTSGEDLLAKYHQKRLMVLEYDVYLSGNNASNNVSITYPTPSYIEDEPIYPANHEYQFKYIADPLNSWSSYNDLKVNLFTSENVSYLTDSDVKFKKVNARNYVSNLNDLKDKDVNFSICSIKHPEGMFIFLLPYIAIGIILTTAGFIFLKKKYNLKKNR